MSLYPRVPAALVLATCLSGVAMAQTPQTTEAPSTSGGSDFGVELQAGRVAVKSANDADVDKSGRIGGASIFVRRAAWAGAYQLGLGWQTSSVTGDNHQRGVYSQNIKVREPFADARYLLALPLGFELGLEARDAFGKGADYDVQKTDHRTNALSAGPVIGYTHPFANWTVGANTSYLIDVRRRDRQVSTLLAGISLAYRFGKSEPARPAPSPAPAAAPAPMAKAEPAPLHTAVEVTELNIDLVKFAFGSAKIEKASQGHILALGRRLAATMAKGATLRVSGHTDSVGPRGVNDRLSLARAKAVRTLLVKAGMNGSAVIAEGHGFHQMLPGIAPTSPFQRRVNLIFAGIDPKTAASLQTMAAVSTKN